MRTRTTILATIPAALLLAACSREDVTHVRVPKVPPSVHAAAPGTDVSSSARAPGSALAWTLPDGWSQQAGGRMRFATLTPPVPGRVDASVVVLPGSAGGELANVNRWRGQIGLEPLGEAALSGARTVLKTDAGPVAVYDFTSEGAPRSRLVAGLTVAAGNTWFLKMTGDAAAVGAAREDFMKLIRSLRLDAR